MKKNMGTTDRLIRILFAIIIGTLYLAKILVGSVTIVLMVFAAVLFISGLIGFCPLYKPFGLNTISSKD